MITQSMVAIQSAAGLIIPEIILIATVCLLFFSAPFVVDDRGQASPGVRHRWGVLALLGLMCALWAWWGQSIQPVGIGPFRLDAMTWYVRGMSLIMAVILIGLNWEQVSDSWNAESQACILAICAGVNLVGAANDLTGLFLALELVSIPTYLFLFLPATTAHGQEAALKYFLLSLFSSGLFLFGLSWMYGSVGTTNLPQLQSAIWANPGEWPLMTMTGLVLVLAGLCFRITAVPFHFYAPDVFAGTQPSCAALLAFVPKVAGFAAMIRLIAPPDGVSVEAHESVLNVLRTLAFLTMFVGNGLALLQTDLRRVLAYSSVAHAGYMLVGLAAGRQTGQPDGIQALLFYLGVYGVMTLGFFAALIAASSPGRPIREIDDLAGLSRTRPGLALVSAILLISMAGLPPTAGFFGKLQLFLAAWTAGTRASHWMAFFLAINAAIAAGYYLRLIGIMYLREPVDEIAEVTPPLQYSALVTAACCSAVSLVLFFVPATLWGIVAR